jgi:hypothetical protein
LRLEEVDVLLLRFEDVLEQLAAHVIADLLAVDDRRLEVRVGDHLELEVAIEDFAHVFADHQLAEVLQVRQPLEEQYAFDELRPTRGASGRRAGRGPSSSACVHAGNTG